jgi:release factor glutamine methyltransferase
LQQYGAARRAGKPVSRIIGQRGFWTLNIQLNADTLDPRPDTEILVETALQRWGAAQAGSPKAAPPASVLDLGTGSGCILLALLSEWAGAMGIGVDISAAALAMAQRNAHVNNITTAHFVAGYWLDAVSSACMFDVVVSNPPYIPWSDADMLQPEVRCHDPERALFADENGLAVYRLLVPQVLPRLAPGGVFAVEVGIHQAAAVADMMRGAGYSSVQITQDYSGIDRVVSACAAH